MLDREKAIDLSIELWEWLAESGEAKEDWPGWVENGGTHPFVPNLCFLCQYDVQEDREARSASKYHPCPFCPYYKRFGPCESEGKVPTTNFDKWKCASTTQDSKRYASAFLNQLRSLKLAGRMRVERSMQLKDLPVGAMFRREHPKATFRYIKSNVKKEEPGSGYYCYNLDGDSDGYFVPGSTGVIRLYPAVYVPTVEIGSPSKKREVPRKVEDPSFYMCYVQGADGPKHKHPDKAIAWGEAERLARTTRKRVYVLEPVASVIYEPPQPRRDVVWTLLAQRRDC